MPVTGVTTDTEALTMTLTARFAAPDIIDAGTHRFHFRRCRTSRANPFGRESYVVTA